MSERRAAIAATGSIVREQLVDALKETTMASNVQDHCQQQGLSLLELAEKSGLDLKRVQAIYLGRWTPNPTEREKIAQALGKPSDEIAWGHQTPIQHIYGHGPG